MVTLTAPGDDEHTLPNGEVCPCTPPGGVDLEAWNPSAGHRFNRLFQDVRRRLGQGEYFKGAEVQSRGALHFHLIVRLVDVERTVTAAEVRELAIKHGFGHSVKVDRVRDERAAGYVAKYCSKAAGDRGRVPWRTVDRATGEVRTKASYRCWTASRRWGMTMALVREEQRAWAISQAAGGGLGAGGAPATAGVPALAPKAPLDPDPRRYTPPAADPPSVGPRWLV